MTKRASTQDYTLVEYPVISARPLVVRPGRPVGTSYATDSAAIRAAKRYLDGGLMYGPANLIEVHHRGVPLVPKWLMGSATKSSGRGGLQISAAPVATSKPHEVSHAPAWWIIVHPDTEHARRRGPYTVERLPGELRYVFDVPHRVECIGVDANIVSFSPEVVTWRERDGTLRTTEVPPGLSYTIPGLGK